MVYLGQDQHVHELSFVATRTKGMASIDTDLTAAAGAPRSYGPPWGFVREDHVSAVVVTDDPSQPHHVHELALTGRWTDIDLDREVNGLGEGSFHAIPFIDSHHPTVLPLCNGDAGNPPWGHLFVVLRDGFTPP